ncbi:Cro/CI family transcriptional regulator [Caballeronia sp. ATUFL_F1_KS4A]|uniref:Cro/CI family transcriptional regulator n=1 Tax=unclassified Caballeronia TaxID=2646786 RepID=UPI0032EBD077
MFTPTELIALLGGPRAVARKLGITHPSVIAWRKAGVPPPRVAQLAVVTGRCVTDSADLEPARWHKIWPDLLDGTELPTENVRAPARRKRSIDDSIPLAKAEKLTR